jgi:hypothetical protein
MITMIFAAQTYLNSTHNAGLVEDGLIGVRTETAMRAAASLVRRGVSGLIQYEYGRASTYGGPDDAGDYYEGQAFFPPADPDGSGPKPAIYTPSRYYNEIVPVPLQAYLRPEMATADRWPVVRGKAVGVSYYLDPSTYYAAARVGGALAVRARGGSGLYLRIYNPAIIDGGEVRQVTVRVIDWGPTAVYTAALAKAAGRPELVGAPWPFKVDLSPGAYAALGLRHGADRVWWEVL